MHEVTADGALDGVGPMAIDRPHGGAHAATCFDSGITGLFYPIKPPSAYSRR
jgi:hypothetical protein